MKRRIIKLFLALLLALGSFSLPSFASVPTSVDIVRLTSNRESSGEVEKLDETKSTVLIEIPDEALDMVKKHYKEILEASIPY